MTKGAGKRPVIICVGNADRGDDALGPDCADLLSNRGLPVRVTPGDAFELLEIFRENKTVFLVDAVVTGQRPSGTIYAFTGESAEITSASWTCSTHGLGVAEALRLSKALGVCPDKVCIYGVEAGNFGWGEGMSPEVSRAIPALADRIEADWRAMTGARRRK